MGRIDELAQFDQCHLAVTLSGRTFTDAVESDDPERLLNGVSGSLVEVESLRPD